MSDKQAVLIQVDHPEQQFKMSTALALLEGMDIKLDPDYGPILIDPKRGRYVLRGTATTEALEEAKRIPGVRLFADLRQQPM